MLLFFLLLLFPHFIPSLPSLPLKKKHRSLGINRLKWWKRAQEKNEVEKGGRGTSHESWEDESCCFAWLCFVPHSTSQDCIGQQVGSSRSLSTTASANCLGTKLFFLSTMCCGAYCCVLYCLPLFAFMHLFSFMLAVVYSLLFYIECRYDWGCSAHAYLKELVPVQILPGVMFAMLWKTGRVWVLNK